MCIDKEFLIYMLPNVVEETTTKKDWTRQLELCQLIFSQMIVSGKDVKGNVLSSELINDAKIIYNRVITQLDIVMESTLLEGE